MSARATLAGATAFYATWFLTSVLPTPLPWYLPLTRRFVLATVVTELGMDFYGRLLFALVAAMLVALAARRWAPPLRLLAAWALSTLALCVALEVTVLSRRVPVPLALPQEHAP
jgi:hypothetical protein